MAKTKYKGQVCEVGKIFYKQCVPLGLRLHVLGSGALDSDCCASPCDIRMSTDVLVKFCLNRPKLRTPKKHPQK
eukprot:1119594-Amphidinium_carterae.1